MNKLWVPQSLDLLLGRRILVQGSKEIQKLC